MTTIPLFHGIPSPFNPGTGLVPRPCENFTSLISELADVSHRAVPYHIPHAKSAKPEVHSVVSNTQPWAGMLSWEGHLARRWRKNKAENATETSTTNKDESVSNNYIICLCQDSRTSRTPRKVRANNSTYKYNAAGYKHRPGQTGLPAAEAQELQWLSRTRRHYISVVWSSEVKTPSSDFVAHTHTLMHTH